VALIVILPMLQRICLGLGRGGALDDSRV